MLRVGEVYPYFIPAGCVGMVCVAYMNGGAPYGATVTDVSEQNMPIKWVNDARLLYDKNLWKLMLGGSFNTGYIRGELICRLSLQVLLEQIAKDADYQSKWGEVIRASYAT